MTFGRILLNIGGILVCLVQEREEYLDVFIMLTKASEYVKNPEFHNRLCYYSTLKYDSVVCE